MGWIIEKFWENAPIFLNLAFVLLAIDIVALVVVLIFVYKQNWERNRLIQKIKSRKPVKFKKETSKGEE